MYTHRKMELQMAEHLPEDVITKIFERLPIKSLIRFTSLSKRWRFIILHDPHFTTSQYQIACHNKTLRHRVCFADCLDSCFFQSLDLQTASCSSLHCSVMHPDCIFYIFCSCRGLLFSIFNDVHEVVWYICNPTTTFFKKLPDPVVKDFQVFCGFGYVSATDDYKILIATSGLEQKEQPKIRIFSSKSNTWTRIQDSQYSVLATTFVGTVLNEAFHWLEKYNIGIVAFDLAKEEFRTMPLPVVEDQYDDYFRYLGDLGGCLCVFGQVETNSGSMDMWVMREYDKGKSWSKLFSLKVSDQPENIYYVKPLLVMETSTLLEVHTESERGAKLVRSYHKEEKTEEIQMDKPGWIPYEESLLRPE